MSRNAITDVASAAITQVMSSAIVPTAIEPLVLVVVLRCGQIGHIAKDCRQRNDEGCL